MARDVQIGADVIGGATKPLHEFLARPRGRIAGAKLDEPGARLVQNLPIGWFRHGRSPCSARRQCTRALARYFLTVICATPSSRAMCSIECPANRCMMKAV